MKEHRFGRRSLSNLSECHPKLIAFAFNMLAASPWDLGIHDGGRTLEEQQENIDNGVSWTLSSDHIPRIPTDYDSKVAVSHAFDYHIIVAGEAQWDEDMYVHMASNILVPVAKTMGLTLDLGAYWQRVDGPHVALEVT